MSETAINFFKADRRSIEFTLFEHFKVQELFDPAFSDYYAHLDKAQIEAVLDQALRFCDEMTGPINGTGDTAGCVLEDGKVITPKGFKEAWKKLYELGLPNFTMELEHGGFQGPSSVNVMLGEVQSGATCGITPKRISCTRVAPTARTPSTGFGSIVSTASENSFAITPAEPKPTASTPANGLRPTATTNSSA